MTKRRSREQTIFFPWERRSSLLRQWLRSRPLMAGLGLIALLLLLGVRERTHTGERSTRASLLVVGEALDAYRADHGGRCPPTLDTLQSKRYLAVEPVDAWGRPLQLTCPGRRHPESYDLMSLGPDGDLGGLDRLE